MPEPSNLYPQLKRAIKPEHLLERNPGAYTGKFALTAAVMAICITLLAMTDNTWVQIGNTALMAFTTVQLAFLGHDAGHRQISGPVSTTTSWDSPSAPSCPRTTTQTSSCR